MIDPTQLLGKINNAINMVANLQSSGISNQDIYHMALTELIKCIIDTDNFIVDSYFKYLSGDCSINGKCLNLKLTFSTVADVKKFFHSTFGTHRFNTLQAVEKTCGVFVEPVNNFYSTLINSTDYQRFLGLKKIRNYFCHNNDDTMNIFHSAYNLTSNMSLFDFVFDFGNNHIKYIDFMNQLMKIIQIIT